jgi:hypothetical protein
MTYWLREAGGWLLLIVGLYFFVLAYDYCEGHNIFEAWVMAVIGIFVFRGGIHLLKVAVAARVCRQAQDRLYPASAAPRQRSEVRSQRSEVRSQRSEVSSQKTGDR